MIDNLIVFALWPLGIFSIIEGVLKQLPWLKEDGRFHWMVPVLPTVLGVATGPIGTPWIISNMDGYTVPGVAMSMLIGAGAGLCSQGVYDVYKRKIKDMIGGKDE
jgi:uncharacterized protein (DUF1810 family)